MAVHAPVSPGPSRGTLNANAGSSRTAVSARTALVALMARGSYGAHVAQVMLVTLIARGSQVARVAQVALVAQIAVATRAAQAAQAPLRELLRAQMSPSEDRYFFWKRTLDVVIACLLLALVSPVMLITAIAVTLSSPGPVLYRQKRVGENGAVFDILKFRSMVNNASSETHRKAIQAYMAGQKLNEASDTNAPYKLANDARITPIGRFIRKTSIDELPQLYNVLVGQMSMVGPRPPVPYEVELYPPHAMERLKGKPGITGPWQVYGRNNVTFDQMIEMDVNYLRQRSVWYDLKLIALTPRAALLGA